MTHSEMIRRLSESTEEHNTKAVIEELINSTYGHSWKHIGQALLEALTLNSSKDE